MKNAKKKKSKHELQINISNNIIVVFSGAVYKCVYIYISKPKCSYYKDPWEEYFAFDSEELNEWPMGGTLLLLRRILSPVFLVAMGKT